MNDDLDEPQFEHEEPAAQHKKRTKKKRPRDNDEDDDATPGAPPILEESAAAAAEPAPTAPVAFQTAGGPAKKPKPPRAAPRDGAAWAAWLRNLLPDADAAALPARCAPPEGDVKMAVAARVRRGQKQGRAVDVVVVCTSARRAADLARTLRDHTKIRRVFKLFGKHKDRKEQERALATLSPLPRVAVATPARLDALRDRVPWAPGAALLVDGAPDAKGYTPFTLPDAKGALAATVAGLLGATDVAFGVVES